MKTYEQKTVKPRTSELVMKSYNKMLLPSITSRMCLLCMSLIDSIIASRFIGTNALAAISLITPIYLISSVIHDLVGSGTVPVITRLKSCGENEKARRALGAICINALTVYAVFFILLSLGARPMLQLVTDDTQLIENGLLYIYPMLLWEPISEVGLVLERGFSTDGKTKFFCFRGILTGICNIIFNLIAIFVFHSGVFGLAVATVLAGTVGYAWSISYGFSDQCTIRPDFSVMKDLKEAFGYIKSEVSVGYVYAIDDGLFAVVGTILSKYLISYGAAALACTALADSLSTIHATIGMSIQSSCYNFMEMYYSDGDIDGTKEVFKSSVIITGLVSMVFIICCVTMQGPIAILYRISDPAVLKLMPLFLLTRSLSSTMILYSNLTSSFMLSTNRAKLANYFNIENNLGLGAGIVLGNIILGLPGVLWGQTIAGALLLLHEIIVLKNSKIVFGEINKSLIADYSFPLDLNTMAEVSENIYHVFRADKKNTTLYRSSAKASLLVEECCNLLIYCNENNPDKVMIDIRVSSYDEGYCITMLDNGYIFDPVERLKNPENPLKIDLSRKLLTGLSPDASYSRVYDVNISHLRFKNNKE